MATTSFRRPLFSDKDPVVKKRFLFYCSFQAASKYFSCDVETEISESVRETAKNSEEQVSKSTSKLDKIKHYTLYDPDLSALRDP